LIGQINADGDEVGSMQIRARHSEPMMSSSL